jgi:hypothetical protein
MRRMIGQHWEEDVLVTWWGDPVTHEVTIERWQDNELALRKVHDINSEGAPSVDGLGRAVIELPVTVAQEYCAKRGIPWEKFMYGNQYDAEYKRLAAEYSRLTYSNHRAVKAS